MTDTGADKFILDDITWNDLDMSRLFKRLDSSLSSVGRDFLKESLKTLNSTESELLKRSEKADYLSKDKAFADKLAKVLKGLGFTKKFSFRDYIFRLSEAQKGSNVIHYILTVLLLASIALIFVKPVIGIIALVAMIVVNISTYFSFKSRIEGYFASVKYLTSIVVASGKLGKLSSDSPLINEDLAALKALSKDFAPMKRGSWLLTNSVSGSLIDVLLDYARMLFHVDIIKFNNCLAFADANKEGIERLFELIGGLELARCIDIYREQNKDNYCLPDFKGHLEFEDIVHPLMLGNAVPNSLNAAKSILLTGSNASGKSTFLKSVALAQIMAQTIYTCHAASYTTDFYKVMSSMALSDNLKDGESYFVVEVKSLRRIFDEIGNTPVLCFVDEVLRGTNTKERIAASGTLLEDLSSRNALVFAATHDIELTKLLEGKMLNYHFSETVTEGSVSFDYKLKEGPSNTRNAIRLLKVFGFPDKLVEDSENLYGSL